MHLSNVISFVTLNRYSCKLRYNECQKPFHYAELCLPSLCELYKYLLGLATAMRIYYIAHLFAELSYIINISQTFLCFEE